MKKRLFQQKCHTGNYVGMSIYVFFTVNYTMSCSFSISKTVNLTVFYSKNTLNVP